MSPTTSPWLVRTFAIYRHLRWARRPKEALRSRRWGHLLFIHGLGSRVHTLEADLVEGGVVTKKPTTPAKGLPGHQGAHHNSRRCWCSGLTSKTNYFLEEGSFCFARKRDLFLCVLLPSFGGVLMLYGGVFVFFWCFFAFHAPADFCWVFFFRRHTTPKRGIPALHTREHHHHTKQQTSHCTPLQSALGKRLRARHSAAMRFGVGLLVSTFSAI